MAVLLDNKNNGKVSDVLIQNIRSMASVSVLSRYFSLNAYSYLKSNLSRVDNFRLLVSSANLLLSVGCNKDLHDLELAGNKADRRFRNSLQLISTAKQCAQWLEGKAEVREASSHVFQNLFHIRNTDESVVAIHGSSSFSSEGLGIVPSDGYEMNTCFTSPAETQSLLQWFDSIWFNQDTTRDIKSLVLEQLENIYVAKSPELLYFLTLYNVFLENIEELGEEFIIKTKTGIKDTLIWKKLYRFQRDGVLGAIDKMEKYNGCIIADSVGLGKTYEALAVIKYYELRNDRVLVLCPKKLRENWSIYTINDRRNIFTKDRFNFDVLNHTDLTRVRGKSGEINLETINWSNYDLVVIDESHNFRNNPMKRKGQTRYSRLMQEIIQAGVKTKVLMLSATPVNNRMNDLKNQVAFITEGNDNALISSGIESIEKTLRTAQGKFTRWLSIPIQDRTLDHLLDSINLGYFKLLDLLTIARSRKHIEKYYDLEEIGAFPERAKPINIKPDIDTEDSFPKLRDINRDIRLLNLSSYAPLRFVLPAKQAEYDRKYDMIVSGIAGRSVFKQSDREQSLVHLMRINLLKRMESSINSFSLTLNRLLGNVRTIIKRIDSHDESEVEELHIEEIDTDDVDYAPYLMGKKVKVLLKDVDRIRWKQELQEDEIILEKLLNEAQEIDANRDQKLQSLKKCIADKCRNPINSGNKKILIFTAFADTAEYLYKNIAKWAQSELDVYSGIVAGRGGANQTTMPNLHKSFDSIITSFSPISKEREKIDDSLSEEISILIATDCLSEGQNLQDCDYLVNYDIHWNPVRIIQRFGRIDRLGSRNKVVQLVNFWPNMELDEYINLESRVSGRMVLLDISATGDENIIEYSDAGKMNDLEYRRRQLEQLQNEVTNIEEIGGTLSISDMTFNNFRFDLAEYLKDNGKLIEKLPYGMFAVTNVDAYQEEDIEPGVIFCLQSEIDKTQADRSNPLAPNYLVWVTKSGEVKMGYSQTKKILDTYNKLCLNHSEINQKAILQFNEETHNGKDMSKYQTLLAKAVAAITGKSEERGVESLFHRGGTLLSNNLFQGIDDFEVVSYLIIMKNHEEIS